MGVVLKSKEKEVSIGYIGFGFIRQKIALSYNEEIGKIYKKAYDPFFKGYTDEDNKYLDKNLPKYLDEFLFHSDCDGYFTSKSVKEIYKELIKLNPKFENENIAKKYNELLELFEDGKRINLY